MEKSKTLNAFFALVFSGKICPEESQAPDTSGKAWSNEDFSSIREDQVRESLKRLDIHKSMDPDGIHPQGLRKLINIIASPLLIIFERSRGSGEVPQN